MECGVLATDPPEKSQISAFTVHVLELRKLKLPQRVEPYFSMTGVFDKRMPREQTDTHTDRMPCNREGGMG